MSAYKLRDGNVPIAMEGDARSASTGQPGVAGALAPVQPPRLHAAATVRMPGGARDDEVELPQDRGAAARFAALAERDRHGACPGSQHAVARVRCNAEASTDRSDAGSAGRAFRAGTIAEPGCLPADSGQHLLRASPSLAALRTGVPEDETRRG